MSSERPRAVSNMPFFVSCQNDVVNNQLFSPISIIVDEIIKAISNFFIFLQEDFTRTKSTKRIQANKNKTSTGRKVACSLVCVSVLFVLFMLFVLFVLFVCGNFSCKKK